MITGKVAPHPRLYLEGAPVGASDGTELLQAALRDVEVRATKYLSEPVLTALPLTHNAHLMRARQMQNRVLSLIAQWFQTNENDYLSAAIANIEAIGEWEHWSWLAWRKDDPSPQATFDLSYGENSATLALAYDLLYPYLSTAQRDNMVDIARRWSIDPFLKIVESGPWWLGMPDSNWNAVCAGGAGMLALAMYDELEQAPGVLATVEKSITAFMTSLGATDGGWPEGIGYWNYGMRYAFMYLLSRESASGSSHSLLQLDTTRKTLSFPLDFCPHRQPSGFGDSNTWSPLAFHFAAAHRLGDNRVIRELAALADPALMWTSSWPTAAELVLARTVSCRADIASSVPDKHNSNPIREYRGLGWVRIADQWPNPSLYLSIRGGSTEVPHGHLDLLSFHAVVAGERLIENLAPTEYLDTSFGPRRSELFEVSPHSKNTILINGVGVTRPAMINPTMTYCGEYPAVFLDATSAMGRGRDNDTLAVFCGRLFVLLGSRAAVVLDRIDLRHHGRVESRLHTRAQVDSGHKSAQLAGQRQRMTLAFGASAPFTLSSMPTVPTTPGDEAVLLRWHGPKELSKHFVMAAVLVPGTEEAAVEVNSAGDELELEIRIGREITRLQIGDLTTYTELPTTR